MLVVAEAGSNVLREVPFIRELYGDAATGPELRSLALAAAGISRPNVPNAATTANFSKRCVIFSCLLESISQRGCE